MSSLSLSDSARLSQMKKVRYDAMTLAAIEIASTIDPFVEDLPVGTEVPAIDAVRGHRAVDIRPRLVDDATGRTRLIDSGAQLSATCRRPEDKEDNSVNLIAVNGSKIQTYGVRELEVKIGRKTYRIQAVVCDIKEDNTSILLLFPNHHSPIVNYSY